MQEKKKIVWKKCSRCDFLQHPSHLRCLNCKNNEFNFIESTDNCTLFTYTILNAPPSEFWDKKRYALGVVEFENGIKALGQITTTQNLTIGMRLKLFYTKICEDMDGKEIFSFVFQPYDSAS
jgi:uncharacterized OB-fold protein